MTALLITLLIFPALVGVMFAAWLFQRQERNGGWTDVFWTFAAGGASVAAALLPFGEMTVRQLVVALMVGSWSLRLGVHLLRRVGGTGEEDRRYAAFRREWGAAFQARMLRFALSQAPAGAVLAGAAHVAAHNPAPFGRTLDVLGLALFAVALAGESLADAQLARFKADPENRGRIADKGLWAWSRHPNYFFEWLIWTAIVPIAISASYPLGWWAIAAPAMMFVLLNYVSGAPHVERTMRQSRGAAFDAYAARTSRFFPVPPRAAKAS